MVEKRVRHGFAAVALLAPLLAFVPFDEVSWGNVVGAALAAVAVVLAAKTVSADPAGPANSADEKPDTWARLAPLVYVAAVIVSRHSSEAGASGLASLLLVPLFWVALTGNRFDLAVVTAGIGVALIGPVLLVGGTDYPTLELRRAAVWLLVAPVVGLATQDVVRQARQANAELNDLVRTDALTGLLNRRGFLEIAERELLRVKRTQEPLVVAMLDLDFFKRFNDTQGHAGGDRLLKAVAVAWPKQLRDIDVLARWGGEEFIVVLPKCPAAVAHNVLDRIREATPEGQTCSIGFATLRPNESLADVTARADTALYEAKEAGRNRVIASTAVAV